jgi:hypothetical protein
VAWCEILTFYEAVNDVFICEALPEANIQVNNRILRVFLHIFEAPRLFLLTIIL